MPQHEVIGDAVIQVGHYSAQGGEKKRYRGIGKLMRTRFDDGGEGFWLSLHGDALNTSLLALAKPYLSEGSDAVNVTVFAKREQAAPQARVSRPVPPPPENPGTPDDEVPF